MFRRSVLRLIRRRLVPTVLTPSDISQSEARIAEGITMDEDEDESIKPYQSTVAPRPLLAQLASLKRLTTVPSAKVAAELLKLCVTAEDVALVQKRLPKDVWNSVEVFTGRIPLSKRIKGGARPLSWWLEEIQRVGIVPNPETGFQLVLLCKTPDQLSELRKELPVSLWNDPVLLNNRIQASNKLAPGNLNKKSLSYWLEEIQAGVVPNATTGSLLISRCLTQSDLAEVGKHFPPSVWNNPIVYKHRIEASIRMLEQQGKPLHSPKTTTMESGKVQEVWSRISKLLAKPDTMNERRSLDDALRRHMPSLSSTKIIGGSGRRFPSSVRGAVGIIIPTTVVDLLSACTTPEHIELVRKELPAALWNTAEVLNKRIALSTRILSCARPLSTWLEEAHAPGVTPNILTGCCLVSMCHTKSDLKDVEKHVLPEVWNSVEVFNDRIVASKRIPESAAPLASWLDEMKRYGIVPNSTTASLLLALCQTQSDLSDLRNWLPTNLLQTAGIDLLSSSHARGGSKQPSPKGHFPSRPLQKRCLQQALCTVKDTLSASNVFTFCTTPEHIELVRKELPVVLWNTAEVLNKRMELSTRILSCARPLSTWLEEVRAPGVTPNILTGSCLVSMCHTKSDLKDVEKHVLPEVWNSVEVFNDRIVASKRIPESAAPLASWLDEMKRYGIVPNSTTASLLLALCQTQSDLDNVQKNLPIQMWNNIHVFIHRIVASNRIPESTKPLDWWLQEMKSGVPADQLSLWHLKKVKKLLCGQSLPNVVSASTAAALLEAPTQNNNELSASNAPQLSKEQLPVEQLPLQLLPHRKKPLAWWYEEISRCSIPPTSDIGSHLLRLCRTKSDLDNVQKCLPVDVWNCETVLNTRMNVSQIIPGGTKSLAWWLEEAQRIAVVPRPSTASLLVTLCRSQSDMDTLQTRLPSTVWNSESVFNMRLNVSRKIREGTKPLAWWLQEMQRFSVVPHPSTASRLVILCRSQSDIDNLQKMLPSEVWNSENVFNMRLNVSRTIRGGTKPLIWWLQEMQRFAVVPGRNTASQLVALCRTQSDLSNLQKLLPADVWNDKHVFNSRMGASRRMHGNAKPRASSWLVKRCRIESNPHTIRCVLQNTGEEKSSPAEVVKSHKTTTTSRFTRKCLSLCEDVGLTLQM